MSMRTAVAIETLDDLKRVVVDEAVMSAARTDVLHYFNWLSVQPLVDVEVKVNDFILRKVERVDIGDAFSVAAAIAVLTLKGEGTAFERLIDAIRVVSGM
jgi:hypothetical protein